MPLTFEVNLFSNEPFIVLGFSNNKKKSKIDILASRYIKDFYSSHISNLDIVLISVNLYILHFCVSWLCVVFMRASGTSVTACHRSKILFYGLAQCLGISIGIGISSRSWSWSWPAGSLLLLPAFQGKGKGRKN